MVQLPLVCHILNRCLYIHHGAGLTTNKTVNGFIGRILSFSCFIHFIDALIDLLIELIDLLYLFINVHLLLHDPCILLYFFKGVQRRYDFFHNNYRGAIFGVLLNLPAQHSCIGKIFILCRLDIPSMYKRTIKQLKCTQTRILCFFPLQRSFDILLHHTRKCRIRCHHAKESIQILQHSIIAGQQRICRQLVCILCNAFCRIGTRQIHASTADQNCRDQQQRYQYRDCTRTISFYFFQKLSHNPILNSQQFIKLVEKFAHLAECFIQAVFF